MKTPLLQQNGHTQSGAVLVIGLILLVAMTLIGVTAMKLTTLDERIAANMQAKTAVFQGAESILMETAVYEDAARCFRAQCSCLPNKETGEVREGCIGSDWARAADYAGDERQGGLSVPAVAGMNFEGEVNIYGNSIGSDTAVVGKLVQIRAMSGAKVDPEKQPRGAEAIHNLWVAPIGLREKQ
jgi:Tfp pilus assembly protein PilX